MLTASLFILSGLLLFPGNFQAMLWPLALILIGIFLLRHHHRRNWTHQRTVHRRAKMVQRMMNKRMGEQEEHSTRRNLHRPGLQLGGVELHIPADWQVRIECSCFAADVKTNAGKAHLPNKHSFPPLVRYSCLDSYPLWYHLQIVADTSLQTENSPPPR